MTNISTKVKELLQSQKSEWDVVSFNFAALDNMQVAELGYYGYKVQYNPERKRSTLANLGSAAIGRRKCFLCEQNRPKEQKLVEWGEYSILVNPYPVCKAHYTIPLNEHLPQRLSGRAVDMVRLAKALPDCVVFFNGAKCGASAPDHFHFQAVGKGELPFQAGLDSGFLPIRNIGNVAYGVDVPVRNAALVRIVDFEQEAELFYDYISRLHDADMTNVLCWARDDGRVVFCVFRRKIHRPSCYCEEGIMVSPACVELGGIIITARETDFYKVPTSFKDIFDEICETSELRFDSPFLSVGIMSSPNIQYSINAQTFNANSSDNKLVVDDNYNEFELQEVKIGKDFHWEKFESQRFKGKLRFIEENDMLTAVNDVSVEDYLVSVISSEMSPKAPLEFLKAHAIISRSWVLSQILNKHKCPKKKYSSLRQTEYSIIKWYDHDDHIHFDVCADDHCQRYQGLKEVNEAARVAVAETAGIVLTHNGLICDARFSKCCGGITEEFSTCWEDENHDYMRSVEDPYCNTHDRELLNTVLKEYDQKTLDFYNWTVSYSQDEVSLLVNRKSGLDFGKIIDLVPVKVGKSGRIEILRIIGDKLTFEVGKELEITKWLSESHLYSSAFTVERSSNPTVFTLRGKGWGHGVGLCQIGAAVMASKGFTYDAILSHYYPGAVCKKFY